MAVLLVFGIVGAVAVTAFLFLICFLDVTIGQTLRAVSEADVSQPPQPNQLTAWANHIVRLIPRLLIDVLLLITAAMAAT